MRPVRIDTIAKASWASYTQSIHNRREPAILRIVVWNIQSLLAPRGPKTVKGVDFAAPKQNPSHDEVTFDQRKMEKALEGPFVAMPEDLTREEFRNWMRENARKCRSK